MGYDPSTETLVVQFQSGDYYRYNGVPSDTFVAVITDKESYGKAFNTHIKNKAFPYTKITPEEVVGL